jgi:hypothetical protein
VSLSLSGLLKLMSEWPRELSSVVRSYHELGKLAIVRTQSRIRISSLSQSRAEGSPAIDNISVWVGPRITKAFTMPSTGYIHGVSCFVSSSSSNPNRINTWLFVGDTVTCPLRQAATRRFCHSTVLAGISRYFFLHVFTNTILPLLLKTPGIPKEY